MDRVVITQNNRRVNKSQTSKRFSLKFQPQYNKEPQISLQRKQRRGEGAKFNTCYKENVEMVTPRRRDEDTTIQNTVDPDNGPFIISPTLSDPSVKISELWHQDTNEGK